MAIPIPLPTLTTNILDPTLSLWNGTREQAATLSGLTYPDGTRILTSERTDIFMEVLGLLRNEGYEFVNTYLRNARSPEDVMWNQPAMKESKKKLAREIALYQEPEKGTSGVGNCRYCPSTELVFYRAQTRSGDEAMTVFVRCVMCQKNWKQ